MSNSISNAMRFFILLGFCVTALFTSGQVMFQERLSSTLGMYINDAVQTKDTGYVFGGRFDAGGWEKFFLFKINRQGALLWNNTYFMSTETAYTNNIQSTPDNGLIVSGFSDNPCVACSEWFYIRTDSVGNIIWSKFFDTSSGVGSYMKLTMDNNIIAAGYSYDAVHQESDMSISKLDSSGNILWSRAFKDPGDQGARAVQQATDTGYIILGSGVIAGKEGYHVVKTDSAGFHQWAKTYRTPGKECRLTCGIQASDGGYIVAGNAADSAVGGYKTHICLIKIDANGNPTWSKTYSGQKDDKIYQIKPTADSGFILVGGSESFSFDSTYEALLIKLDSTGNIQWSKTYNGGLFLYSIGLDVLPAPDGGYMIGAVSDSYIIKTDSLGNSGCFENAVFPTIQSSTIISGNSNPNDSNIYPVATTKTISIANEGSLTVLCNNVDIQQPEVYQSQFIISPNPAQNTFTVTTSTEFSSLIEIYDFLGKKMFSNTNCSEYTVDCSAFFSGIYFVKVLSEKGSAERKLVVE